MSSTKSRALVLALMVTVVAAVAAPSAGAYSSSELKYEKAQTSGLLFAKRRVASVAKGLATAADAIGGLAGRVKAVEDRVKGLEAIEYGVARVFANGTAVPGATFVSADIPDVGQPAQANGSIPFLATAGTVLTLKGAIRSNESDGTGSANPAGQAGAVLYAICATPPTRTNPADPATTVPNPKCPIAALGGQALQPGQIACTSGPPPLKTFSTPIGDISRNLASIDTKATVSDQDAPAADGQDIANGGCTLPADGVYNIVVNASFADIPNGIGGNTG